MKKSVLVVSCFTGICLFLMFPLISFSQENLPEPVSLSGIIASGEPELLATDFGFTEGPVWDTRGYLLFTDVFVSHIVMWEPKGSKTDMFRSMTGQANGLAIDQKGRLIACEGAKRRVTRLEPDGTVSVLAEKFEDKLFNSPNDVTIKSDGSIYFTDPTSGMGTNTKELDFQGIFRIKPDGELVLAESRMRFPNGIAFSPDEKVLYVSESGMMRIFAFDVLEDGTLANKHIFAKLIDKEAQGAPDGMQVDIEGNIYATGPGGVWVFDKYGRHLGTVSTPEIPTNCAFGGPGNKTLFITAGKSLYRIFTKVKGIGKQKN